MKNLLLVCFAFCASTAFAFDQCPAGQEFAFGQCVDIPGAGPAVGQAPHCAPNEIYAFGYCMTRPN